MKLLQYVFIIVVFLYLLLSTQCLAENVIVNQFKFDPLGAMKELAEVIDILNSKQSTHPDVHLNITQLVEKYGYPVQEYKVTTEDGYVLTMFRIEKKGPPVLLMHGILLSADDWVIAGPDDGLAYILASSGYDVWMGNARGNKYSRQHESISPEDSKFWEFSWNEIGVNDLPAMIDFVLETTSEKQLAYIGHSQGTTSFFVMCSEKPEYNQKISIMIALAPIAAIPNAKSPLARILAPYHYYANVLVKLFKIHEVLPMPVEYQYMENPVCEIGNGIICSTVLFMFTGFDYEQINQTNLPVIFSHTPSGSSAQQFIHYLQIINSGVFRKFDYGDNKNQAIYGSSKPPKYRLELVKAPVALFYSENDWFSDVEDVTNLQNKLPNVKEMYLVPFKKFNHADFLWAKDVKRLVYARITDVLKDSKSMKTI
ncbi:lipase 3-like [Trichoplusia ni]|uniref:Lipase n=1 Tax=Trichoplusia ni TaxID=7111 RepID=A0A7E5VBL5_TRINI|nr:lipase 3-like [Trichoplusia ni]